MKTDFLRALLISFLMLCTDYFNCEVTYDLTKSRKRDTKTKQPLTCHLLNVYLGLRFVLAVLFPHCE